MSYPWSTIYTVLNAVHARRYVARFFPSNYIHFDRSQSLPRGSNLVENIIAFKLGGFNLLDDLSAVSLST